MDKIKNILDWCLYIIIAIVLALLIRYFIGTPTIVKNVSMEPTLMQNQRLILNRIFRTIKDTPKRGQIVTFEEPSKSDTNINLDNPVATYAYEPQGIINKFIYYVLEINKTSYIKRVIALPSEHIKIDSGKVYINDIELEEDYLQNNVITDSGNGLYTDLVVPEGHVFVMGDNRAHSTDSRNFGCIPISKIESVVLIRFWPLNLLGKV